VWGRGRPAGSLTAQSLREHEEMAEGRQGVERVSEASVCSEQIFAGGGSALGTGSFCWLFCGVLLHSLRTSQRVTPHPQGGVALSHSCASANLFGRWCWPAKAEVLRGGQRKYPVVRPHSPGSGQKKAWQPWLPGKVSYFRSAGEERGRPQFTGETLTTRPPWRWMLCWVSSILSKVTKRTVLARLCRR